MFKKIYSGRLIVLEIKSYMQLNVAKNIKTKFHKSIKVDRGNCYSICGYGKSKKRSRTLRDQNKYLLSFYKATDIIVSLIIFIILSPLLLLMKLDSYLEEISDIFGKNKRVINAT